jgi:hypothetical protein
MTDKHPRPITPPPELVRQWLAEPEYVSGWNGKCTLISVTNHRFSNICAKAAQWGADQELESCCEEMKSLPSPLGIPFGEMASNALRAARRSKPPNLKEQALKIMSKDEWSTEEESIIRRALELLPDDTTP